MGSESTRPLRSALLAPAAVSCAAPVDRTPATDEVHASPSPLAATFVAELSLSVECWVPVSAGSSDRTGAGARRLHPGLGDPGCIPLRGLL
jgi:hypothetical protein